MITNTKAFREIKNQQQNKQKPLSFWDMSTKQIINQ